MTRNDLELPQLAQLPRLGSLRVGVHHGTPAPMGKGMREEERKLGRMVIPAFQVPGGGISWSALERELWPLPHRVVRQAPPRAGALGVEALSRIGGRNGKLRPPLPINLGSNVWADGAGSSLTFALRSAMQSQSRGKRAGRLQMARRECRQRIVVVVCNLAPLCLGSVPRQSHCQAVWSSSHCPVLSCPVERAGSQAQSRDPTVHFPLPVNRSLRGLAQRAQRTHRQCISGCGAEHGC